MTRPARVIINLSALQHNLQRIHELAPASKVMAVIKADAYGHGLTRIARNLNNVDAFGVACLEEARELRASGINHQILLLEGPYNANELSEIAQSKLDIVIHDIQQVEMLESFQSDYAYPVWLKIDTGMHRLGFLPEQVNSVWHRLNQCDQVDKNIKLMTHLALANDRNSMMTAKQIECFEEICKDLNGEKTIANSASILAFPQSHADWVRPGLMLFGVSPFPESNGIDERLQAVMTLESRLISVKQLKKGDSVGYGASWCCPEDMLVGIVAAGYGDGYPRHAPSGTPVLVNGKRVTLIGHASMDMLTIDLRDQPDAKTGDQVILWGDGLPVEEIARCAGTIPYELLSAVHKRLEFIEHG